MKNKGVIVSMILILATLVLSGCTDFFFENGTIRYESHPTKISFTISYGYRVNCTGSGDYEIQYDCDLPEVLKGQILSTSANDVDYSDKTLATYNEVKSWSINSNINRDYDLGITASVLSEGFIVADLNGANALTIQEVNEQYPDVVAQYTQAQKNETTVFINPDHPEIKAAAETIRDNSGTNTNNSFLIAKELFIWLKQQTTYQVHLIENIVQPADVTLNCKTGDCDDLSYLYMSLCRAVRIPARFIRGFLIEEQSAVPHAWVEVFVGGNVGENGWIPVECAGTSGDADIEVNQNFGLESADHLRIFTDDGSDESLIISLSGLTYVTYGGRILQTTYYADITSYTVLQLNELTIDENGNRSYT